MTDTQNTPTTIPDSVLAELGRRYGLYDRMADQAARRAREALDLGQVARALANEQASQRSWMRFAHFAEGVAASLGVDRDHVFAAARLADLDTNLTALVGVS